MELDSMLVGEGTAFIFPSEDKGKVRFHCHEDVERTSELDMVKGVQAGDGTDLFTLLLLFVYF